MGLSIQDYLKKINSRVSLLDCLSLLVTMFFLLGFSFYLYQQKVSNRIPVSYSAASNGFSGEESSYDSRPFGSSKGKTYTFSWCQGSAMILAKNKVYFKNEADAEFKGISLSKLCQK